MGHLKRAAEEAERLGMATRAGIALLDALRLSPQPMLILRADLRIDWLNDAALAFAARRLAVGVRGGRLAVRDAKDRLRVQALVRAASTGDGGGPPAPAPLLVSDPALARPLRLLAVPLRGVALAPSTGVEQPSGHALLFLEAAETVLPSLEQTRAMFGLTAVEAEIALDLLRGAAPADIAATRNVSLNTVRTHVRRILEKSATTRIPEFLAKILGSP